MNRIAQTLLGSAVILLLAITVRPGSAEAATMNDFCITPSFIQASVPANLLMLFDNSSSMYDLAYVDKGMKHCSASTAKSCSYNYDCSYCSTTTSQKCYVNADCPGSETCNTTETCGFFSSTSDRRPFYCYDETYSNANVYAGYFANSDSLGNDVYYYYRPAPADDFAQTTTAFPAGCPTDAANTTKTIPNTLCVEINPTNKSLVSLVAKGNYLNWLTASKLDVQKKILTGGKYDGSYLVAQSRGCVGQGFVKDANTADFVNFAGGAANDTNTGLGVTFTITGEANPRNPTAPYIGSQTYINIFFGSSKYDYSKCQQAMDAIVNAHDPAEINNKVAACLAATTPELGICHNDPNVPKRSCAGTYAPDTPNCDVAARPAHCTGTSVACTPATQDVDCYQGSTLTCTAGKVGALCPGGTNAECDVKTCSGNGVSCSVTDPDCQHAAVGGTCTQGQTPSGGCTPSNPCGNKNATCVGYKAGYDNGTCGVSTAGVCTAGGVWDHRPCVAATAATNIGPCDLTAHAAMTKAKVTFGQTMQACWQYSNKVATATTLPIAGNDEYTTVRQKCPEIYSGYKSCSNNRMQACTTSADCVTPGTCDSGPTAIGPGNEALLCGTEYEGPMFQDDGTGAWVMRSSLPSSLPAGCASTDDVELCVRKIHDRFCANLLVPNVTDPTDSPSDSIVFDNVPAILSGVGVEAQLGQAIARMRVKIAAPAAPTGLIQEFASKIRIGAMSFNFDGSASEKGVSIPASKICESIPTKSCTSELDCPVGDHCIDTTVGTTIKDGASVIYKIGLGKCYNTTTSPPTLATPSTTCATDRTCGTGKACVPDGPGDHVSADTLVKAIDDIVANAWTPFSEAFYEAIGYFGNRKTCGGTVGNANCETDSECGSGVKCTWSGSSRTDLRLNANDYNENYNPSNYKCQKNFVLLISDGMSTADRNEHVDDLAKLYTAAGGATSWTTGTGACPPYGGSRNLDNMAWIAHNRDIGSFSTSTASTETSPFARDFITTYVVFNGESNGQPLECDSETLLKQTAINGGTTLKQANDYNGLVQKLRSVFEDVAAQSASGTAASILSNSEGSGASLLQALFFPKKEFDAGTSTLWSGELHNLWYYFNPLLTTSSVREDTDQNNQLDLAADRVVEFRFDDDPQSSTYNQTMAWRYRDVYGDDTIKSAVVPPKVTPDDVNSLWRAGKLLWSRTSARNIYTPCLAGGNCTDGAVPTSSATRLMSFSAANDARLQPFMQTSGAGAGSETADMINYVNGTEFGGYRSRTISIKNKTTNVTSSGVWKLGDIISSTPRLQSTTKLNAYDQPPPVGYNDKSYTDFTSSTAYKDKGMVYVGANDGMLHAFNLGVLDVTPSGTMKATIIDKTSPAMGLGTEAWAFIPQNALPYLRYLSCKSGNGDTNCNNADYSHLYYVDGQTTIVDAAIGKPAACTESDVANCLKVDKQNWRSVLISGMGLGGASRDATDTSCEEGITGTCVKTPVTGQGYSSYFALDVTDPTSPKFKWEFSDAAIPALEAEYRGLGFATTGVATVKINATTGQDKNGKWFAVFGSGPTGPINKTTHQFLGTSHQPLKVYVVALDATPPFEQGSNYWVLDKVHSTPTDAGTTLDNAFVGSMSNAAIDTDRWNRTSPGFYSDDALYLGYVQKNASEDLWESGGVLRLVTNEDPNPANWRLSKVIDSTGPVVTAVARLQDRKNKKLWLYFGTGRYFYKDDDLNTSRSIYAVMEPCYTAANDLDTTCYTKFVPNDLADQTLANNLTVSNGWFINLEAQDVPKVGYGAERVISDAVALTNGAVFFTSFKPTTDVCGFGGNSYLWATAYDTGLQAPTAALQGRALIQLSTGEFKEVDLAGAFTGNNYRRMATPMTGKPPSDPPPLVSKSNLKPVKKILHIQEK